MKTFFLFFCILTSVTGFAQSINRITINGKISVTSNDKEGISVFNTASNKGTLTNVNGEFTIKAAVNDIIEFRALQFKDFSIQITKDIIKSKKVTVILVEEINKLDEVVILPFGLTGYIHTDLENVRTYNVSLDEVYFGLDHIEDFEFSADYKTKTTNIAFNDNNPEVEHMFNLVNLAGFLVSQVIDINKKTTKKDKQIRRSPFKKALDNYSYKFIQNNFNIPLHQMEAFISYVEQNTKDSKLLAKDKELEFLEHLTLLSKTFLKHNNE